MIKTLAITGGVTAIYILPFIFSLIFKDDGESKELRAMGTFGVYSIPSCITISTTMSAISNDNTFQLLNIIPATGMTGFIIADQRNNY